MKMEAQPGHRLSIVGRLVAMSFGACVLSLSSAAAAAAADKALLSINPDSSSAPAKEEECAEG